jgi:hypothetical protein
LGLVDPLAVLFKKFTGTRGRRIERIKFLIAVVGDLDYLDLRYGSRILSASVIFLIAALYLKSG